MTEKLTMEESFEKAFDEIEARGAVEEAPKEVTDEFTEEVTEEVTEEISEQDASPEGVEEIDAPEHWSAEERERFRSISDPEARRMLLDVRQSLERGFNRKFEELAETRRSAAELDKVFQPYEQNLRLAGVSRAQAVERLLAAQKYLESSPREAIQWLASQYNVNLDSPGEQPDPDNAGLINRIRTLEQSIQQQQLSEQQSRLRTVEQSIEAFRSEKDSAGNPKHPHFDAVSGYMVKLANGNPDATLEQLYEQAVYANPETRAAVLAKEQRDRQLEQARAAKAKAAAAKKAATPSGAGGKEAVKGATMEETMAMVYDRVAAGS